MSTATFSKDLSANYQVTLYPKVLRLENPISIDSVLELSSLGYFDQAEPPGVADRNFEYWFEIDFSDHFDLLLKTDTIYFYPGGVEISHLYIFQNGNIKELNLTLMAKNDLKRNTYQNIHYLPISGSDLIEGSKLFVKSSYLRATPDLNKKIFAFSTPEAHHLLAGYISPESFKVQVLAYFFSWCSSRFDDIQSDSVLLCQGISVHLLQLFPAFPADILFPDQSQSCGLLRI
ncbi:hypothetical protein [Algoriphagus boritolerans]|uniref:hypothetical protein n=1 Tax=Algoriphagus boritolerans TaxID=308111 RepID=UPI000B048391